MQIHFKKFEPEREYTLMVYDSDLSNFVEKIIPDSPEKVKEQLLEAYAMLINELGIYLTPSNDN